MNSEAVNSEAVNREAVDLKSDVLVRPVSRRDLDALMRVCLEWPGAPAADDPGLLRDLLEQALSDDDATLYLAVTGSSSAGSSSAGPETEVAIGFAHVTFQARPVRLGWRCTIEELHAIPEFAGQLEPRLLEAIVHECRERGDVIALYLLTQPDLEPRQFEFYSSLGFKERGREVLIWNGGLV